MKANQLKARREARLNRPSSHDCCIQARLYLRLRFVVDIWCWFLEIGKREVRILYCPWCGRRLNIYESSNS